MIEFNRDEYYKRRKELRELDIFISEHLFNQPLKFWWYVSNHDGDDMIDYFNHHGEEYHKQPLYEIKKEDQEYHEVNPEYIDPDEDIRDGVHRWNFRVIPKYSSSLNLMRECESKLRELGEDLADNYVINLVEIVKPNAIQFDMVHADSEAKARAMVETLKRKNNG